LTPSDDDIADAILTLLNERGAGKSICPSEAARRLCPEPGEAWRALMPSVRRGGFVLVERGALAATQKGQAVDPQTLKGPIRFQRRA